MTAFIPMLVGLGALGAPGPATTRAIEPEAGTGSQDAEAAPDDAQTPPETTEPPVVTPDPVEPEPEPVCEPACPGGSMCSQGQCFVACDPSTGECNPDQAAPQPEPAPVVEVPVDIEVVEPEEPEEPTIARGVDLVVAPGVAACLGSGCREVSLGSSSGSVGVGGSLDLRLAYRATPHLSVDLGTITSFHGNDIDSSPLSMWTSVLVGPRLHLSGGRWKAEPIVGVRAGYVRSLVRWTNAGTAADGLALAAEAGVLVEVRPRISLGMTTSVTLPYWARVCDADNDLRSCYGRSDLTSNDLRRWLWSTGVVVVARLF